MYSTFFGIVIIDDVIIDVVLAIGPVSRTLAISYGWLVHPWSPARPVLVPVPRGHFDVVGCTREVRGVCPENEITEIEIVRILFKPFGICLLPIFFFTSKKG